jgi:hypothetical protein
MIRFKSVIKILGINPYVLVSAVRAKQIKAGWKKPLPVLVRINAEPKKPWRINMMPVGNGSFYLYLHESVRKVSGTKVGDKVEVEIEFDADYKSGPTHPLPLSFKKQLSRNSKAKKAWDKLSPSRKKEILRYFASLKSKEALERNIEKAVEVLAGKEMRFMARAWKDGR